MMRIAAYPDPDRSRFKSALIFFLLIHITFLGYTSLLYSSSPSPIKIESQEGVDSAQVKNATLAINEMVVFFSENYQLVLNKKLRIILVPDEQGYAAVLQKEFGYPPAQAKKMARTTGGTARDEIGQYVMVYKANQSRAALMQGVSHEMIHWYQYQTASEKAPQIKWLLEGAAHVIACYVLEKNIKGNLQKYRQACLKGLRQAKKIPPLKELYSRKDWNAAMDKYGAGVVYNKAGLAVLTLGQEKGYKKIFHYFLNLRQHNNARAFQLAFGKNLQEFEKQMDRKFGKQRPAPRKGK